MQIIAKRTLIRFWEKHPQAERPLRAWYGLADKALWDGPADVKAMFGTTVDFVADNRLVFDIGGNKFRRAPVRSESSRRGNEIRPFSRNSSSSGTPIFGLRFESDAHASREPAGSRYIHSRLEPLGQG